MPTLNIPVNADEDDSWLRSALAQLQHHDQWPGHPLWEAIGARILERARRDAHGKPFEDDYCSAYATAAIRYLRESTQDVIAARSCWGIVICRAQHAGDNAIGEVLSGGLHARDTHRHRVNPRNCPRVVPFEPLLHDRAATR